jgi:hypothetical protein
VFVKEPSGDLTIQPGTTIYGEEATIGTLIVERGAQIHAVGTANSPIVFTTSRKYFGGALDRGLWGGIIVAGYAPINIVDGGGGEAPIEGTTGLYGGLNPNDNSGEIQYVRIEYAGHLFSETSELNGLALHGVGNGTTIDHVQILMNKDDCIEMFGGTADMKYVIGTWCRDDSFDWTEGWTGRAQYIIVSQRGDEADAGAECDNYEFGHDNTPRSAPTIYNMTFVGDPSGTYGAESTYGMRLRRGTAGEIRNWVITGFNTYGLRVDDTATVTQINTGNLNVSNGCLYNNGAAYNTNAQNAVTGGFWTDHYTDDCMLCNPLPKDIYDFVDATKQYKPNFAPAPGSPLTDGTITVATPTDPWFDTTDYIGAVDPDNDWTYGWTSFGTAKQLVCDVNYSGSVTVTDAQKILRMASGKDSVQSCADPNLSGSVTVTDAQKALRYASGKDPLEICCNQ